MDLEKKQQAKHLFFQTDLTKTQIANTLGVNRRTLGSWVKEGNWNRLRTSAAHLPSIIAENCYHIMGHLTEDFLSERRLTNPVSNKDADTLHKLATTINKLKNRSTLNESMEMFGFFLDSVKRRNPELAAEIVPYIDDYIASRSDIYTHSLLPESFTGIGGRIPWVEEDPTERIIDNRERFFSDPDTIETYAAAGIPLPSEEEISRPPESQAKETPPPAPKGWSKPQVNEERAEALRRFNASRTRKTSQRNCHSDEGRTSLSDEGRTFTFFPAPEGLLPDPKTRSSGRRDTPIAIGVASPDNTDRLASPDNTEMLASSYKEKNSWNLWNPFYP